MPKTDLFDQLAPTIMARLIDDLGLTNPDDAAAILGNIGCECDGFTALQERQPLVPGSRGGWGWCQWTGPRRREFEAWVKRKGYDPCGFEAQYSFLFRELTGSEKGALPRLKKARTLEAKTEVFMLGFLRPGIPHLGTRIFWAKRARELLDQRPLTVPAPPDVSTPAVPVADAAPVSPPSTGGLLAWLRGFFA